MSSKTLPEQQADHEAPPGRWQTPRETAPSLVREDEPRVARMVGLVGLSALVLGTVAVLFYATGRVSRIGPGLGSLFAVVGLGGLLFHAARDKDLQVRRLYGAFGFLWLVVAAIVTALPIRGPAGALFLPYGFLSLSLALPFLLAFAHNETEEGWRDRTVQVLGGVGGLLALTGFIGSIVSNAFLLPNGVVLAVLGLGYLWAYVALRGTTSDAGYWTGVAMGAAGVAVFLIALGRAALPPLFHALGWAGARPEGAYLASGGLLLMTLGLLYAGISATLCSDNPVAVLTRRELAAFFYSPIAYIVLCGLVAVGGFQFLLFVNNLLLASEANQPLVEPVVRFYIISFVPVVAVIFAVPAVTMRLLSEEKRTGTIEVLLTAPLTEAGIVLSKFFAALVFFMALWIPWGLFLLALRVEGAQAFDYRPLLGFALALAATGASFLSMGLFFSSLTHNQIIAAVLTFMGMMALVSIYFFTNFIIPEGTVWRTVLTHASFVDFWQQSLQGKLALRDLLFPVSATVFWLFLTVKVLEARKWS
jgi:ABC-type transport system involved in multi-copper enzyme maturation permease subunit